MQHINELKWSEVFEKYLCYHRSGILIAVFLYYCSKNPDYFVFVWVLIVDLCFDNMHIRKLQGYILTKRGTDLQELQLIVDQVMAELEK